jgi:hypothetical protein
MTPTLENAYAPLGAIDRMDRPARLGLVAETARAFAGTRALASVLADSNTDGGAGRELAPTMARITRREETLCAVRDEDFE